MLDLFSKAKKSTIPDLNIVPVLDMLISVIFFLLLTTSFLQFTKQSVPPSSLKGVSDPQVPPPVTPKVFAIKVPEGLKIVLKWAGAKPGYKAKVIVLPANMSRDQERKELNDTVAELVNEFTAEYPHEKTLQIGLGADVAYQDLVTIMDGVKEKMPDMVLLSYEESLVAKSLNP